MLNLTLKEFLNLYNFRYVTGSEENPRGENNDVIRIYPFEENSNYYFEYGYYDYYSKEVTKKYNEKILSKEILNMYIYSIENFYNNYGLNIVSIYLTKDKNWE